MAEMGAIPPLWQRTVFCETASCQMPAVARLRSIMGWVTKKMPTMASPEHRPAMPSVTIIRRGPA